ESADIRISLDGNDRRQLYRDRNPGTVDIHGLWSEVGNAAVTAPKYFVSLNLHDLHLQRGNPIEFNHTILHEFGHALGLMHEHQRDLCAGWFNFGQIAKDTGWSIEKVRQHIGSMPSSWSTGVVSVGPYDKNSIMQYNFSLNWYISKLGNPC